METKAIKYKFLKVTGLILIVLAIVYSAVACSAINSAPAVAINDLFGKKYYSPSKVDYVAFLTEKQAYFFKEEGGDYYDFTLSENFIVLSNDAANDIKFVALDSGTLFLVRSNTMFTADSVN